MSHENTKNSSAISYKKNVVMGDSQKNSGSGVEKLHFHLPNEQQPTFDPTDSMHYTKQKESENSSMFLMWMENNKKDLQARKLFYSEYPSTYIWKSKEKSWQPRQRGPRIGRLQHVPPSCGELYYLRILLHKKPGVTEWDEFKTVDNILYPTYKDACYAYGLLEDENQYIHSNLMAPDVPHVEQPKKTKPDSNEANIYKSPETVSTCNADTTFHRSIYTELCIKIGAPIICIRNINQEAGLCIGAKLQVLRMGVHVIEAKIISGEKAGHIGTIPRMLITQSNSKMPFKNNKREFPVSA